jgi:uncharacterized protein (DUF885 family)
VNARQLADGYWQQILELNPMLATQVGQEEFDDRLPDFSIQGIERRRDIHSKAMAEATTARQTARDLWDRVICDTIDAVASPEVASIGLAMHWLAPIDHLWGPGTMLEQMSALQRADNQVRLDRYLRRLAGIERYLDQASLLLDDAPKQLTAPRLIVDRCLCQVETILTTPPEESVAHRPIPATNLDGRRRVADVLRSTALPAYSRYLEALKRYRVAARESLGLHGMEGGEGMYRAAIQKWTSLALEPDDIHHLGQEQLSGIQAERMALARRLGSEDPASAVKSYASNPHNRFNSRKDIVQLAEEQVRRGWERSHEYFGRLPRSNCEVRPVEPSRENYVLEHYFPGTPDGSRPAIYYVNTARPDQRARHSLASVSFHEANPGHHLQITLEQEQPDRPALLRYGGEVAGAAFIEGWGLYAERLADEMSLFLDDYERMGMLEGQAVRAARLVVDTGLHALGWTRERAVEVMKSTGLEASAAEMETDRYVAMPGQALAYKIGQIEIEAVRERMERSQDAAFSLRNFHDKVLSLGSVPLETFRRELAG